MQAYNQAITDLDKELDYLKSAFEVTAMSSPFLSYLYFLWTTFLSRYTNVYSPLRLLSKHYEEICCLYVDFPSPQKKIVRFFMRKDWIHSTNKIDTLTKDILRRIVFLYSE